MPSHNEFRKLTPEEITEVFRRFPALEKVLGVLRGHVRRGRADEARKGADRPGRGPYRAVPLLH